MVRAQFFVASNLRFSALTMDLSWLLESLAQGACAHCHYSLPFGAVNLLVIAKFRKPVCLLLSKPHLSSPSQSIYRWC